jgi:hypothetical protein
MQPPKIRHAAAQIKKANALFSPQTNPISMGRHKKMLSKHNTAPRMYRIMERFIAYLL